MENIVFEGKEYTIKRIKKAHYLVAVGDESEAA